MKTSETVTASMSKSQDALVFEQVSKDFDVGTTTHRAIDDVSFAIRRERFAALIGPSGCGKTTILRLAAGLTRPTTGKIYSEGTPVSGINTRIGYITQDSNLFPWLTTLDNIAYPLKLAGLERDKRQEIALDWVTRVGLSGFEHHYPHQLSGGMQKRASIARSLVYSRETVLMDEPFGPLDAQTRMVLQDELLRLWQDRLMSVLFVTHDLVEAIALSDMVVLMGKNPGHVKRIWSVEIPRPRDIFTIHTNPEFRELYEAIWEHFRPDVLG